jgi:hypothetical protein
MSQSPSRDELRRAADAAKNPVYWLRAVGNRAPEGRLMKCQADALATGGVVTAMNDLRIALAALPDGFPMRVSGYPDDPRVMHAIIQLRDTAAAIMAQRHALDGPLDGPKVFRFGDGALAWLGRAGEYLAPPELVERLERVAAALAGQLGEPAAPEPPCDTQAWLSARDLAARYEVNYGALRRRLERFRDTSDQGWREVKGRSVRSANYLYLASAVQHVIEGLRAR